MKKGIIKKIEAKDKFKEMFKFELTMDNGDVGMIFKVENDAKVKEGEEVHYTLKPNGSMKIVNPEYANHNNNNNISYSTSNDEDNIRKAVALKCASQIAAASGLSGKETISLATSFLNDFLNKDEIKPTTNISSTTDDLPF